MDCFVASLLAMTKRVISADSVSQCDAQGSLEWSRLKFRNEFGTNRARIADSPALLIRSPQHLAWNTHRGTRSSLAALDKRRFGGEFLKIESHPELNQNRARVNRDFRASSRHCKERSDEAIHPSRISQFVFATRGGEAVVTKLVASSIAGPSGVGIFIQNGTRMRVPATGANAISMLRWAVRYLITGRSGI